MKQQKYLIIIALLALIVAACAQPTPAPTPPPSTPFNVYYPDATRTLAPNQNVIMDAIQLVTPEDKVGANTTTAELSNFITAAEQKTQQIFAQNNAEFKLLLRFTIYPKDTYKVEIATQGDVANTALQTLHDELQTLPPIYTKTDPIVFQVAFTVKANK